MWRDREHAKEKKRSVSVGQFRRPITEMNGAGRARKEGRKKENGNKKSNVEREGGNIEKACLMEISGSEAGGNLRLTASGMARIRGNGPGLSVLVILRNSCTVTELDGPPFHCLQFWV